MGARQERRFPPLFLKLLLTFSLVLTSSQALLVSTKAFNSDDQHLLGRAENLQLAFVSDLRTNDLKLTVLALVPSLRRPFFILVADVWQGAPVLHLVGAVALGVIYPLGTWVISTRYPKIDRFARWFFLIMAWLVALTVLCRLLIPPASKWREGNWEAYVTGLDGVGIKNLSNSPDSNNNSAGEPI